MILCNDEDNGNHDDRVLTIAYEKIMKTGICNIYIDGVESLHILNTTTFYHLHDWYHRHDVPYNINEMLPPKTELLGTDMFFQNILQGNFTDP